MYKNGLAGITKATVSITFDNSDKKQSPLGFETHDEITITRQVRVLKSLIVIRSCPITGITSKITLKLIEVHKNCLFVS